MLSEQEQLLVQLAKFICHEKLNDWLNRPLEEFGDQSPRQFLDTKNYQPLWALLSRLERVNAIGMVSSKKTC